MQDQALLAELPNIAASDSEAKVRRAALQRITRPDVLNQCRQKDDDAGNRQLATERLVHVVCQIHSDDVAAQNQTVFTDFLDDPDLPVTHIETIAAQARHRSLRQAALQRSKRAGFLGDRVLQETDPELQQQALNQIEQVSTLERIAKSLRKTNKKLFHQTQQKLENLQPAKQGQRLDDEQALRLCQRLEKLAQGQSDGNHQQGEKADLRASLDDIEQVWSALNGIDAALERRYRNILGILKQALAGPRTPEKTEAAETPQQQPAAANEQQADQSLQHLAVALDEMLRSRPKPATVENWRETWRAAWSKLSAPSAADQRLQEQLRNRLAEHEQQQAETREQREARQVQLDDRIEAIRQAAEDGQLETATTKLQTLREELPGKPPGKLMARLRAIDQQLGELRRWQRWSDNEQRIRLIKTVEKALKDELNPDALLTLIRDVRSTWQQLEEQEVTHGMRPLAKDHSLVRQFNGVCGRAMGQARPFLDNRRKVQQERSELLKTLLDNTRKLLEQDDIDARELIKHKRILGKSFRELPGLPPKKRKKTADAIRKLQDRISQRLTDRFADAEAAKRKLIRQAEQLQHLGDRQEAIEQAKQLQRQWKSAGPTSRKVDQQLWEAFRAPLDPLFEDQQQQRAEQQAEREAQHADQVRLCEQLEALADSDEQELAGIAGKIEGLQDRWPEQRVFDKRLQARFRAAGDKFQKRLNNWKTQQRDQRQQALADAAQQRQDAVAELLKSGPDGLSDDTREALGKLGQQSADELRGTLEKHDAKARVLCITAEFLSGLPSPEEDKDARMQYQVSRLAERMSQRDQQQELSAELRELEQRWYANQPLSPAHYKTLNSRFSKALKAAWQLSGE